MGGQSKLNRVGADQDLKHWKNPAAGEILVYKLQESMYLQLTVVGSYRWGGGEALANVTEGHREGPKGEPDSYDQLQFDGGWILHIKETSASW